MFLNKINVKAVSSISSKVSKNELHISYVVLLGFILFRFVILYPLYCLLDEVSQSSVKLFYFIQVLKIIKRDE